MNLRIFAFERIGPELKLVPLCARRALDLAGVKLPLVGWLDLPIEARQEIARLGEKDRVDPAAVRTAVAPARAACRDVAPLDEASLSILDPRAADLLGAGRPLTRQGWAQLDRLCRFALWHLILRGDPARLAEAYDEILAAPLSHLSASGQAAMVDVGDKPVAHRRAVARARLRMLPETARLAAEGSGKGDVLAAARIAGIMASKRTSELIPLCHPIALSRVTVELSVDAAAGLVTIDAACEAHDRTGVEMEAMCAASIAALTVYDMLKSAERGIAIEEVVLLEKSGGRSGSWRREER